jgi:membrane protease YdiL (CAAX protease family)
VAILEVVAAFLFVHVLYRAIKEFTAWGKWEGVAHLNFTPGFVMILFTVGLLLLCRRDSGQYGLTFDGWSAGLNIGLGWGLVLVAGAAILRVLGVRHEAGMSPPTIAEGLIYAAATVGAVVFLSRLPKRQSALSNRFPAIAGVLLLLGLLCSPLVFALYYRRPLVPTFTTIMWLVFGAGCGEEVFYRGYIQSRLNAAFGRPFRFFGVQFGIGLLVSSLLFGFLHALNTVDYFHGRYTFAWGFCLTTIGAGLFYGCLRETTGSVVAGIVCHGLVDVLVIIPRLVSGV